MGLICWETRNFSSGVHRFHEKLIAGKHNLLQHLIHGVYQALPRECAQVCSGLKETGPRCAGLSRHHCLAALAPGYSIPHYQRDAARSPAQTILETYCSL
jgi:hypothetical protein